MKNLITPLFLFLLVSPMAFGGGAGNTEKLGSDCKLEGASTDLPSKKKARMIFNYSDTKNPDNSDLPNGEVSIQWSDANDHQTVKETFPVHVSLKNDAIDIFSADGKSPAGALIVDKSHGAAYAKFGPKQNFMWLNCSVPKKIAGSENQAKDPSVESSPIETAFTEEGKAQRGFAPNDRAEDAESHPENVDGTL